ncbi:MAG: S26 family signal peptidase [Bacteroidota bacterium]
MKYVFLLGGFLLLLSCQDRKNQVRQLRVVAWNGMEPLISKGDTILVNEALTYKRNDLVAIFKTHAETDSMIFIPARIVGLPGESIQMIDTKIQINGQPYADPPEVNFPYVLATEGVDSSFFEDHDISRYAYAVGDFWSANLTEIQLKAIKEDPRIGQINLTLRHILGQDWVVGQTESNNWGKINWGPIQIPSVGDKVVLNDQNRDFYSSLAFVEKKKNLVETELYYVLSDDRESSYDSRYEGFIPKWALLGKIDFSGQHSTSDIRLYPGPQP